MDPFTRVIAKSYEQDPDGTDMLMQLSLYEAFCESVEQIEPFFDHDVRALTVQKNEDIRKALVRTYIDRRLANREVEDLYDVAKNLVVVDVAISKDKSGDDPATPWYDARDMDGRFTRAMTALSQPRSPGVGNGSRGVAQVLTSNSRYDQARLFGNALNVDAAPTAVRSVGAAAQIVGSLSPEAQQVLERGIRRTAYRYRGTEKRPNAGLKSVVGRVDSDTTASLTENASLRASIKGNALGRGEKDPVQTTTAHYISNDDDGGTYLYRQMNDQQLAMRVRGDLAANYLRRYVPKGNLTEISQEAGGQPPSIGVMIDSKGEMVSEAMGFNGDHYLPFDLKNLKRLHGGQYVRTRAAGGPTSEDVYTGLLTSTRQIQVISNSGVFNIEFDPDLRGGRRYSDKAKKMVQRYDALLNAIKDGDFYVRDVPATKKAELRAKALTNAQALGQDRTQAEEAYTKLLAKERFATTFGHDDEASIHEMAESAVRDDETSFGRRYAPAERRKAMEEALSTAKQEMAERQVIKLKLDGEGYYTAMQALQQEFPYYIRDVDYTPLPQFVQSRGLLAPGEIGPKHSRKSDKGRLQFNGLAGAAVQRTAAAERDVPKVMEASTPGATASGGASVLSDPVQRDLIQSATVDSMQAIVTAMREMKKIHTQNGTSLDYEDMPQHDIDKEPDQVAVAMSGPKPFMWALAKGRGDLDKALGFLLQDSTPDETVDAVAQSALFIAKEFSEYGGQSGGNVQAERAMKAAERLSTVLSLRNPYKGPLPSDPAALLRVDAKPYAPPAEVLAMSSDTKFKNYLGGREQNDGDYVGMLLSAGIRTPEQAEARAKKLAQQAQVVRSVTDEDVEEGKSLPAFDIPGADNIQEARAAVNDASSAFMRQLAAAHELRSILTRVKLVAAVRGVGGDPSFGLPPTSGAALEESEEDLDKRYAPLHSRRVRKSVPRSPRLEVLSKSDLSPLAHQFHQALLRAQ